MLTEEQTVNYHEDCFVLFFVVVTRTIKRGLDMLQIQEWKTERTTSINSGLSNVDMMPGKTISYCSRHKDKRLQFPTITVGQQLRWEGNLRDRLNHYCNTTIYCGMYL